MVTNENILLDALYELVGEDNLYVSTAHCVNVNNVFYRSTADPTRPAW